MLTEADLVEKDCSVRVAVRIRPQNSRELIDMCRICTTVTPEEPQIILGSDKAFTFDYVYDINSNQCDIYSECVARLVEGALHGYNATVLAYGQTGSGKTFTMGTGFDHTFSDHQLGIIPRAVRHLFAGIDGMQVPAVDEDTPAHANTQFSVAVQFIELYNEDIIDLLDPYSKSRNFKIHESTSGQITVTGATIKPIHEPQDALKYLQQGALARTTASTKMNDQSSRSHALFTILIRRQQILTSDNNFTDNDLETLTSKFHFVDLAGSERLKRTLATGERAREGISINCGLLSLGNCISALGDKTKKATHVPYRDSKLTRLLQDSLGGNSQTLMIACVSPSDRDFMETLNTLKYANRARNIKNKVQINQDQTSRTISQLRREIATLQLELLEYKQGKRVVDCEGNTSVSDTFYENTLLLADNKRLQQRLKAMQETIHILTERNTQLKLEKETHKWSIEENADSDFTNVVGTYLSEIEKLQAKLIESDEMYHQLKKANSAANSPRGAKVVADVHTDANDIINIAKRGLEKERELLMSRSLAGAEDEPMDADDVESLGSESDSEGEHKTNEMEADLNEINSDIEIKTKLIEQLELSQQRMQIMRHHYEEKLTALNCKISNTQKERDEVLAKIASNTSIQSNDNSKKVKSEYERKITDMQRELKRLQQAQKEHNRQQRELKAQEAKLQNLRIELNDLKCNKVKLMKKISEQSNRHKEEDTKKAREIAQLRKEQRRQKNTVLSLQAQVNAKEQILKRKTEEVSALRRSQRGALSQKAAGRVALKNQKNINFITRAALQRWENLSRTISHAARNKQMITQLEKELERLVMERENLSHELAGVQRRMKVSKISDDSNEEDNIKTNLSYIQENIEHVQQAIMEFEEGKDSAQNDTQKIQSLLENVTTVEEAKYLLQKLSNNAVAMSCSSALTESRLQEHEALLKDAQQESGIQQQLLQHFLSQNSNVQISDLFNSLNIGGGLSLATTLQRSDSQKSLISNGTYDIPQDEAMEAAAYVEVQIPTSRSSSPISVIDTSYERSPKVRRRTARRQDLLFGDGENQNQRDPMTRSYTQHEPMNRHLIPLMRVPSAPGSLKQTLQTTTASPKNAPTNNNSSAQSPRLARRSNKAAAGFVELVNEVPQSPPTYHRSISREDAAVNSNSDVFSRLGAGTQDPLPGGDIQKYAGKIRLSDPLYCTHTVSGHQSSVLSIKVHNDTLYTAAADRTVKVWNLSQQTAQHCLTTHPAAVVAIQNDITTGLLFSASGAYVRVWDLRVSNAKAIKTITSSGLLLAGNANITAAALGETPITAMCLGPSGNLYVAASDKVRIWDLKTIACVGKLTGGHQAAIMCMTSWSGSIGEHTDYVATGSKDHYVKVFEVPHFGGTACASLNLEPPHYDGVQALVVPQHAAGMDVELFSGSRDSGIKQWDLKSGKLKQSLNNAHKGWVSAMAISGDILLSGCRGGLVRLWNVNTCESIADMKTEVMLTDIAASGQRIFTASSDGKVRVWRWNNHLRRQYSMDSS